MLFDSYAKRTFIDIEETRRALAQEELQFPLVVKPRKGSASIGVSFVDSWEELELVLLEVAGQGFGAGISAITEDEKKPFSKWFDEYIETIKPWVILE